MEDLKIYDKVTDHIEKRDAELDTEEEYIDISEMPMFNENALYNKLTKIDQLDDNSLADIIENNYSRILDNVFEQNRDSAFYLSLFLDQRFLTMFTNIIGEQKNITDTDRVLCNKIAYDYLTSNDMSNIKPEFKSLFLNLSKRVNFQVIPRLLSLGLDEATCSYLALSRYSHTDPKVYIRRLNHIIVSHSDSIMAEQMIIDIYQILATSFIPLFKYTMFDVSTEDELNAIGPGASEIYSTISLTMIDILNQFTSTDIRKILVEYSNEYNSSDNLQVRFSMRSISESDYWRILKVIDILEYEQIPVP